MREHKGSSSSVRRERPQRLPSNTFSNKFPKEKSSDDDGDDGDDDTPKTGTLAGPILEILVSLERAQKIIVEKTLKT